MLLIRREKAAIVSALHAVQPSLSSTTLYQSSITTSSASSTWSSSSTSRPLTAKSFTRSHRVRDIVFMISEERSGISRDEYNDDNEAIVNPAEAEAADRLQPAAHCSYNNWFRVNDENAAVGRQPLFARTSRCWSCTATDGSSIEDVPTAANCQLIPPRRQSSSVWKRTFNRLFRKKSNKRIEDDAGRQ